MSSNETSLLLKIRGDAAGGKAAVAETRAAVASLRSTVTPEFAAMQAAGAKAFTGIGDSLNTFVAQRIPLIGPAFVRVTESMKGFTNATGAATEGLAGTATAAGTAGTNIAAMVGPIGIAIAAVAAFAIGMGLLVKKTFELAQSTAEWKGKLFDLSQQTGVNVETLSALEIVAKTTGGSIESIAQSLVIFQGHLDEAQDLSTKAGQKFAELGISVTDTEQAFADALRVLAAMPTGFHQTNEAAELFGRRGGKQVLAILKEMGGDLPGTIARLREMGLVLSEEDARAADEFNDQIAIVQFQLRALTAQIARDAVPVILDALKALSVMVKENKDTLDTLGAGVTFFAHTFRGAVIAINTELEKARPILEKAAELYERIARATGRFTPGFGVEASLGVVVPGTGEFGGGEAGIAATAAHQPLGIRDAEAEARAKKAREEERQRIDFVLKLVEAQKVLRDSLRNVKTETHLYAVEQSILNGILKDASPGLQEDAKRQARNLDNLETQARLRKQLHEFLIQQNEEVRKSNEGEKGHIQIAEELIAQLEKEGAVLQEVTKQRIRSNAAILASVDARKRLAETIERMEPLLAREGEGEGLSEEEIGRLSGAAADAAAGTPPLPDPNEFTTRQQAIVAGLETMRDAFDGLGQAVGHAVASFVLYGTAGKSVRQVTAEVLASIAQMAATKAIFHLAEGFAALAMAFFGIPNAGPSAAMHFKAAAMYGVVAGIAAVAGRVAASDSFSQGSGGAGGGGGSGGGGRPGAPSRPSLTEVDRRNFNEPVEIRLVLAGGIHDVVEASVVKNWTGNGRIRTVIKNDGQG